MWRSVTCLVVGWILWAYTGASAGAGPRAQSGDDFLVAVALVGLVVGSAWPGAHLRTGALLVAPGAGGVLGLILEDRGVDLLWWTLTLVLGGYLAAGTHRLAAECRRLALRWAGWGRRWIVSVRRQPGEIGPRLPPPSAQT